MTGFALPHMRPPGWTPENPDLSTLAQCLTAWAKARHEKITQKESEE